MSPRIKAPKKEAGIRGYINKGIFKKGKKRAVWAFCLEFFDGKEMVEVLIIPLKKTK